MDVKEEMTENEMFLLDNIKLEHDEPTIFYITSDGQINVSKSGITTEQDFHLGCSFETNIKNEDYIGESDIKIEEPIFESDIINEEPNFESDVKIEETQVQLEDVTTHHEQLDDTEERKTDLCGKTRSDLQTHHQRHRIDRQLECFDCKKTFTQIGSLRDHSRLHMKSLLDVHRPIQLSSPSGEKPFTCSDCPAKYSQLAYLNNHHRKKHTSQRKRNYSCDRCSVSFVNKISLKNHIRDGDDQEQFKCAYCGEKYVWRCDFEKHLTIHEGERRFECNMCSKRFLSQFSRTRHIRRAHLVERSHTCKFCQANLKTKQSLDRHIRTHTRVKPFDCDECSESFREKYYLFAHKKKAHVISSDVVETTEKVEEIRTQNLPTSRSANGTVGKTHTTASGKKSYPCEYCSKCFLRKIELTVHRRMHTETLFHCSECPAKFRQSTYLSDHIKSSHSTVGVGRRFSCDRCSVSFSSKACLKKHIPKDASEENFKCIYCDEKYAWKCDFQKHVTTHNPVENFKRFHNPVENDKRFECNVCFKHFVGKKSLNRHTSRAHSYERPYSCNYCDMKLKTKQSLDRHIRTHTREKPFNCDECSSSFREKYYLFAHKKKHHSANSEDNKLLTSEFKEANDVETLVSPDPMEMYISSEVKSEFQSTV